MPRILKVLINFSILLCITIISVGGIFWIKPQNLPQQTQTAIIASMDRVKAKMYNHDHQLYAHLHIEHAKFHPKNIITASDAEVRIQDPYESYLTASSLTVEPHQPWRFYIAQLQRNPTQCRVTIQSPYLEYDPETHNIHTPSPVSVAMGGAYITMQGIDIPTKENIIHFGPHLKGSLKPNDPCTLDFNT